MFDTHSCFGYTSYWFDLTVGRQRLGNSDQVNLTSSPSPSSCMVFTSIDVTTLRCGTGVIIINLSSCESFARRSVRVVRYHRRDGILFIFFFPSHFFVPRPQRPDCHATRALHEYARFRQPRRQHATPSRFKCTAPPTVVTGSKCRRGRCVLRTMVRRA